MTTDNLDQLHEELAAILVDIGVAQTLIVKLRSRLGDVHRRILGVIATPQTLDDLDPNPGECRHGTPIGDWCAYCNETPEG